MIGMQTRAAMQRTASAISDIVGIFQQRYGARHLQLEISDSYNSRFLWML
jgi:hypothetical protein